MKFLILLIALFSTMALRDARADACDDANRTLNERIDEDSRELDKLIAAYRRERDDPSGKPHEAARLHCLQQTVDAKNEVERLELFKKAARACGSRLRTGCDLKCRIRDVAAWEKTRKQLCDTYEAELKNSRDPSPAEPVPVPSPSTGTWPTETKRVPNFYGTTW